MDSWEQLLLSPDHGRDDASDGGAADHRRRPFPVDVGAITSDTKGGQRKQESGDPTTKSLEGFIGQRPTFVGTAMICFLRPLRDDAFGGTWNHIVEFL